MKVIIAGGRDFTDWDMFQGYMSTLPPWVGIDEVVSGGASGADALGEQWAQLHGKPCKVFHAEWDRLGKRAGPIRNAEMSIYGNGLIAFWDGKSKGTQHMIKMMVDAGKWTYVVRTDIPWNREWNGSSPILNNVEVYNANAQTA
jgi:hypothetical protein